MRALALTLALLCFAAAVSAQHVVMISVDGLRPLDALGKGGCETPRALAELMQSGVFAEGMVGVLPTVTYPSHATLVTGTYPARHGVVNNGRARDKAPWHFERADIAVPTVWDAARARKLSVAIVTWPSSYGADVDYLIPEDLSNAKDVTQRIKAGSTPGLFEALEGKAGAVALLPFGDREAGVPLDAMTAAFAQEIVRRRKPNLLLLHFLDLDHREHYEGIASPAACAALQRIDRHIAAIRVAYGDAGILDRTTFVVVSDHGFAPVHTAINVRELLKQSGLEEAPRLSMAGGSAAIYLDDAVQAHVRERVESRFRGILRWITAPEAERMGGFPGAAFVLCAAPGYSLTASATLPLQVRSQAFKGAHGYCPDEPMMSATFVAGGAGIRPLGAIPRIRMVDVAPTIAALLGFELPDAEGNAIVGILAPAR
jgi:predicted AlkP superfamily pyrophosphatase or phosphodiesterase